MSRGGDPPLTGRGVAAGQWWHLIPPVETPVECDGRDHRLRWSAGRLEAPDHPDAEGERTLGALGGATCPCIDLFDAWCRHRDDLRVLTLASRGPDDLVVQPARLAGVRPPAPAQPMPWPPRPGWSSFGPGVTASTFTFSRASGTPPWGPGPTRPGVLDLDDLWLVFGAAGGLWGRLVATVVTTWTERSLAGDPRCHAARPAMAAALYGRATASLRRLVGDPGLAVDVEMIEPGLEPEIGRRGEGVQVRLPFNWLRDLWVVDLALVVGRLGLTLLESGPDRYRVLTVGPDLTDRRPVTIGIG